MKLTISKILKALLCRIFFITDVYRLLLHCVVFLLAWILVLLVLCISGRNLNDLSLPSPATMNSLAICCVFEDPYNCSRILINWPTPYLAQLCSIAMQILRFSNSSWPEATFCYSLFIFLFFFSFSLGAALYERVGLTLPYRQLTKNLPVIRGWKL